ncbi:MAG: hypothetical protein HY243_15715 [Proteobacteria bacterium]|nr:hypothetical protein [Pseudomonadota bacterium]
MRGQKKRQEQSNRHAVTIDGFELYWQRRSEPRYTTDLGHQGLRILVRLAQSTRRELILEYPFGEKKPSGMAHVPERPKIDPRAVEADIRRAMDAGWNPASRGKPFNFLVPE